VAEFKRIFSGARDAFKQERVFRNAMDLAGSVLLALGKRTVSGMLAAGQRQFQDWTSAYRLFRNGRFDRKRLFAPARECVVAALGDGDPLNVMMDDTMIRKRGKKVSGAGWKRDPLGPPFHTNFVWGQRYLQISAALTDPDIEGRARGIPIDFVHAPTPVKPRKKAPPEEWAQYKVQQKRCRVSAVGARCLAELHEQLPDRRLVCAADGGYTNKEVFRSIPGDTVLIGRIRKDARLFGVPEAEATRRGRARYYGTPLPTPEQVFRDDSIPWQKAVAYLAGKINEFDVKVMSPVRWKSSGERDVLVVILRPLAYRPRKGARLLYRDPAYLICSDVCMPVDKILQSYIWRWEIESNFRDEKTIIGVGEAQVRTKTSVEYLPPFVVACYSFLHLAARAARVKPTDVAAPKWYPQQDSNRCSTNMLLSMFRAQFWSLNEKKNKRGLVPNPLGDSFPGQNRLNLLNPFASAVVYARK
jgi:hypothetical protein